MNIELAKNLLEAVPDLKLGINHYTKITVSESPQMLKGKLQLFQEQLFFELEDKSITDLAPIKEWRTIWKTLGADPNRYRNSSEALMRRIKQENFIKPFHNAVDLNNFLSLQHSIPMGIYDFQKIVGDVLVTTGTNDDGYDGLNGRFNSLKDIILLKDDYSSFGSPYVDSIRTAVTEETTEALHIYFLRPSMDAAKAFELTRACGNMFTSLSGGDVRSYVLHEGQTSITVV